MKTSNKGINLIKSFEGLRLRAYKPVSTEKYYTIGYGHYGADVTANMVITETQAIEYLKKDLEKFEDFDGAITCIIQSKISAILKKLLHNKIYKLNAF